MSGHYALGQELWRRAPGGGLPAGAYARRLQLKSIESILRQGLDRKRVPEQQELELSIAHENIRGSDYYH